MGSGQQGSIPHIQANYGRVTMSIHRDGNSIGEFDFGKEMRQFKNRTPELLRT